MKTLICITSLIFSSFVFGVGSDTALLAKILGQSVAQLKELKEIWEINKSTLSELESANRKVQQTRYQILRTKYILDSAKTLQYSSISNTQDAINYMRKTKNLGKESKNLFEEIGSLSQEDKAALSTELDKADKEAISIQDRIIERKVSLLNNKLNETRLSEHDNEIKKYDPLIELNEATSSSTLDATSAQVETAKNTSITNRLLLHNSQIQSEQLKETYRMNRVLEESELQRLKRDKEATEVWGLKRN